MNIKDVKIKIDNLIKEHHDLDDEEKKIKNEIQQYKIWKSFYMNNPYNYKEATLNEVLEELDGCIKRKENLINLSTYKIPSIIYRVGMNGGTIKYIWPDYKRIYKNQWTTKTDFDLIAVWEEKERVCKKEYWLWPVEKDWLINTYKNWKIIKIKDNSTSEEEVLQFYKK